MPTRTGVLGRGFPGPFLLLVGSTVVASVVFVRATLLDGDVYKDALRRADAYERVYTEVLADPELTSLAERLVASLVPASEENAVALRAVSTSALRWALPPARLQAGAERLVDQLMAYVRGRTPRLDASVSVADVLDRLDEVAAAEISTVLAQAGEATAASLEQFDRSVRDFVAELADGRVPVAVPVYGGGVVEPERALSVVLDALGSRVSERAREQIAAALIDDRVRDALVMTASEMVAERAARIAEELRRATARPAKLDVVTEISDRSGRPVATVVRSLNAMRDVARWFGWPTAVGGLLVAGAGMALILLSTHGRRALLVVGFGLVASGALLFAAWTVLGLLVASPLSPATTSSAGGWRLPVGVRNVLADVEANLASVFNGRIRMLAGVSVASGLPLVVGAGLLSRSGWATARRVLVPAGGSAACAAAVWAAGTLTGPGAELACNGSPALCDRRYDEVVFAATHNSMSSPDVVEVWPEQDLDIRGQLDSGVRALLVDTHYWRPVLSEAQLAAAEPLLGSRVVRHLFPRLGERLAAKPGTYLCHNLCALGAVPLVDALREVRAFLDTNPRDVVTLLIQDAITKEDTEEAFRAAGLMSHLYAHRGRFGWPTLGEMVEAGRRLVVFAEAQGPPPAWYHAAFEHIQETPFLFRSPEEFSCAPNRGDPHAPLFLMNHWVQRAAPDRADAVVVNRHDVIVNRARRCERERGQIPNFIAVNFSNVGDVVRAADTLNRLGAGM